MRQNIKHDKSTDKFFDLEKMKMEKEIQVLDEKISSFKDKYNCTFKEFEILTLEGDVEEGDWTEYLDWKTLINRSRILRSEVRRISNRKNITFGGN